MRRVVALLAVVGLLATGTAYVRAQGLAGNNCPGVPTPTTTLSYQQVTGITMASAKTITSIPSGIVYALVTTNAAIRYRSDGTAPTASIGMPAATQTTFIICGRQLSDSQFIAQGATATLDVELYSVP